MYLRYMVLAWEVLSSQSQHLTFLQIVHAYLR